MRRQMGRLDDMALARVKLWLASDHTHTAERLAELSEQPQPWMSRYINGVMQRSVELDVLDRIARAMGLSGIGALFDHQLTEDETAVLTRWRALPRRRQRIYLEMLQEWVPDEPPRRGRQPSPRQSGK